MKLNFQRDTFILLGLSFVIANTGYAAENTQDRLTKLHSNNYLLKEAENGNCILPIIPYFNVDGNIRTYFFKKNLSKAGLSNQHSYSLGGKINVLTEDLDGFRFGATAYTAQPAGLNSNNPKKIERTLPGKPVTALGQTFLQYENVSFLTRIGNQIIINPWLNEADSRMIPATYQGFYAKFMPSSEIHLTAMRLIRFKSRISSGFSKTNLYNPINEGTLADALSKQNVIGTLALGAEYKQTHLKAQAWGYQFYDLTKLFYSDVSYILETSTLVNPLVGLQLGHQDHDRKKAFNYSNVVRKNSDMIGALLGAEIAEGSFTVGYNKIPKRTGNYMNGDLLSPYTSSYASDPLYTTSMLAGLIEKAAGSAAKVTGRYNFFEKKLSLLASYARYYTRPFIHNTSETDVDVTYRPNKTFKDLSLRYRIGILKHNPAFGRLVSHRLMFQYDFR